MSGKLSCNWLIMLVTMATPISSNVKKKIAFSLRAVKITLVSSIHLTMQRDFYFSVVSTGFFGGLKTSGVCTLRAKSILGGSDSLNTCEILECES